MNILEPGGLTIMIVNARHIKCVPGHKTNKKDSAQVCKLLRAGLKVIYQMLKDNTTYHKPRPNDQGEKRKQAQIKDYKEQLNKHIGEDSPEEKSAQRHTNSKADFYWDNRPDHETGLNN